MQHTFSFLYMIHEHSNLMEKIMNPKSRDHLFRSCLICRLKEHLTIYILPHTNIEECKYAGIR
jgi:hypothetical protein